MSSEYSNVSDVFHPLVKIYTDLAPPADLFARYLAAKKTVDDRALNKTVLDALRLHLRTGTMERPLCVLEVGAGIGTMIERALEWGFLPGEVHYTAIDAQVEPIEEARRRLPLWADVQGYTCHTEHDALVLDHSSGQIVVRLLAADMLAFADTAAGGDLDLIVANAMLDLVHVPTALPRLFRLLRSDGLFYFSITFDGATIFEPQLIPGLDEQIEALYHADMDARRVNGLPTGGSRAGRSLLRELPAAGAPIVAAGSSDWVVYPREMGCYPADEAFFLHFIIRTIQDALSGHPELDGEAFAEWIARRHAQIDAGELIYIAHQLDVLGRTPVLAGLSR